MKVTPVVGVIKAPSKKGKDEMKLLPYEPFFFL